MSALPVGLLELAATEAPSAESRRAQSDRDRAKRPHHARATTLGKRALRRTLPVLHEAYQRPATRADCASVPRPCPYVSCRYNLYLEVTRRGSLRIAQPWLEPEQVNPARSCSLDVAERGTSTFSEIASALNLTRARVQQVEEIAKRKLAESGEMEDV